MKYGLHNTLYIGKPVAHVYDANGLEYTKCISIDTETGEIYRYKTDKSGMVTMDYRGDPQTETIKVAAPVLVVFKEKETKC